MGMSRVQRQILDLKASVAGVTASLGPLAPILKGIGLAAIGASVALAALTVKAMKKAWESTEKGKARVEELTGALDKLEVAFGRVAISAAEQEGAVDASIGTLENLASLFRAAEENQASLNESQKVSLEQTMPLMHVAWNLLTADIQIFNV